MEEHTPRGSLIVLEGLDKVGKTTHVEDVVIALTRQNLRVASMVFPNRTTDIGSIIDKVLTKRLVLQPEAAHLLFCANRWEFAACITAAMRDGITVIMDRYAFSGVAYSVAQGLDLDWCTGPDCGLPKPDCVFYLHTDEARLAVKVPMVSPFYIKPIELTETEVVQKGALDAFLAMRSHEDCSVHWVDIDTSEDQKDVHTQLMGHIVDILCREKDSNIDLLSFP